MKQGKQKCPVCWVYAVIFILTAVLLTASVYSGESGQRSKEEFCSAVNHKFSEFGWSRITCNPDRWNVFDYSEKGYPLLYQEFGFDRTDSRSAVNLVLCGVHGDELSAVYQCFHLVRHIVFDNPGNADGARVVIAPIVNPDGFFLNTRQNASGIDPNRNLPTQDWYDEAHKVWSRHNRDPRKYPGENPGVAVETRFQSYLIDQYQPDKILSFHAPLGFLDFDGPGDRKYRNLVRVEHRARHLGLNIEANTDRLLKFVDYRFFPGSLGNYAGNERNIPTYTLELPSAHASDAYHYWKAIEFALVKALKFPVYDNGARNALIRIQQTFNQVSPFESRRFDIQEPSLSEQKDLQHPDS